MRGAPLSIGMLAGLKAVVRAALDRLADAVASIPLSWVKALFVGLYVVLAIWVVTLPASATRRDPARARRLADLRLWALVAIGLQIAIYLCL